MVAIKIPFGSLSNPVLKKKRNIARLKISPILRKVEINSFKKLFPCKYITARNINGIITPIANPSQSLSYFVFKNSKN